MHIESFDAGNISRLPRAIGDSCEPGRAYISSLVRNGPTPYVENADVRMDALLIDGKVLPLVINKGRLGNSNVCSPCAHYVEYALHEFSKRARILNRLASALAFPLGTVLNSGLVERVVYVNNWLLSTNPNHGLSPGQVDAVSRHLRDRHPDSAIVFRSINPVSDPSGMKALTTNGYRLVPSRTVYMLDTRVGRNLAHANTREDLRKLKNTAFSIVDTPEALASHVGRMTELYRALYLGKHSLLNPQFTDEFFRMTLENGFLSYRALIEDGRVAGFMNFFVDEGMLTGVGIGYDLNRPRKLALYRLAFAVLIAEAAKLRLIANLSAGKGEFKMLRGAVPVQEYDALYDGHLPPYRRFAWRFLEVLARIGAIASRRLHPRPSR